MTFPAFHSQAKAVVWASIRLIIIFLFTFAKGSALRAEPDGWRPEIRTAEQANGQSKAAAQPLAPTVAKERSSTADISALPAKQVIEQERPMTMEKKAENNVAAPAADAELVDNEKRISRESLAERYCRVAVDPAAVAKMREEAKKAQLVKAEIEGKLTELEAAVSNLKEWLQRREDFKKRATENLVTVYAQMDAEAAAQRLVLIGEQTAAAILMKLPAKNASAVLGEMQPEMASKITSYMAGAAAVNTKNDVQAGAPR